MIIGSSFGYWSNCEKHPTPSPAPSPTTNITAALSADLTISDPKKRLDAFDRDYDAELEKCKDQALEYVKRNGNLSPEEQKNATRQIQQLFADAKPVPVALQLNALNGTEATNAATVSAATTQLKAVCDRAMNVAESALPEELNAKGTSS